MFEAVAPPSTNARASPLWTSSQPTPSPAEARKLLETIDTGALAGLRDRALLSVMLYSFARVSAVLGMRRQDYFGQGSHLRTVGAVLEDAGLPSRQLLEQRRSGRTLHQEGGTGRDESAGDGAPRLPVQSHRVGPWEDS